MSFLTVNQLSAGYGGKNIIDNISFSLESGCLMGVLGANGSGKTTLIKALCGILPHKGKCTVGQTVLEELSPKQIAKIVSYIPQRSGISIDISVLDVVLMGFNPYLGLLERPTSAMKKTAEEMLSGVGLAGKENDNYMHLSEGQKQLCILARTLVTDSKLLLLDEPESALDFRFRYQMLSLLKNRIEESHCSAVVALHDPSLALNCCDKLLLISDGRAECVIDPKNDPLEETEKMLGKLYGNVSLQVCRNKKGVSQIVMLREDET